MVQNFLVKKDPTNPGVRGIAARFEALAAASPPPSPMNNNRPKISFKKLSFSPSDNQNNQPLPVKPQSIRPPKGEVSPPTKVNGTENKVPDLPVEAVSLPVEPVFGAEVHQQRDEEVPVEVAEVAPSKVLQDGELEVITDLVGDIVVEERADQHEQSPSFVENVDETEEEITEEENAVEEEPSPSITADVTEKDMIAEEINEEEPSQSITAEKTVGNVDGTTQEESATEQKSFASDTTGQASEIVLEE